MKQLHFDGYTMDAEAINFIGKVESVGFGGSQSSYGFEVVVNGYGVVVGKTNSKPDSNKIREEFVKQWKEVVKDER